MSRRPLAPLTVAAVVALVGTFLPWLRSGARSRSSYDLLGLVDRLELANGLGATLIRWWPVVPLLLTATVVAAWWGGRWTVLAVAVAAATVVLTVALLVRRGARRASLALGVGPWIAVAGVVALVGCSVWLVRVRRARSASPLADSVPSPHAQSR